MTVSPAELVVDTISKEVAEDGMPGSVDGSTVDDGGLQIDVLVGEEGIVDMTVSPAELVVVIISREVEEGELTGTTDDSSVETEELGIDGVSLLEVTPELPLGVPLAEGTKVISCPSIGIVVAVERPVGSVTSTALVEMMVSP